MAKSPMEIDNENWLKEGKKKGATHVLNVCDTFDWENYPVYVMPGEDLEKVKARYDGVNMQQIDDVIEVK